MIDVARAFFHFDIPAPPENILVDYAQTIFDNLDAAAANLLPVPDYSLYVAVEEGSLKGGGKVAILASVTSASGTTETSVRASGRLLATAEL
jgi:hypothetical protein